MKKRPVSALALASIVLPLTSVLLAACGDGGSGNPAASDLTLTPKSAVVPGSAQTSNAVLVNEAGSVPVSVGGTGASYSVNGGPYTSAPGTVQSNDQVTVKTVASSTLGATNAAILTINGRSSAFSVVTETLAQQTAAVQAAVKNVVVIYAENRSFDNLYGDFPGANGIPASASQYGQQLDRDGKTLLAKLPKTWGGVVAAGSPDGTTVTEAQSDGLANAPFAIETAFQANANGTTLSASTITRDLYHRFFENQMQIGDGSNNQFAAWSDAGGLTMGHFATSKSSALYKLAQQNVLADNFFEGAFGGSFLNHQYLVCACAPTYPNADTAAAKPTVATVNTNADGSYTHTLTPKSTSPASALDGPPVYVLSGNIAPKDYFGKGDGFRAVNTMQPPFQPSANAPAAGDATHQYADPAKANTLPVQTQPTMGDLLSAKNLTWTWYTGAWDQLTASTTAATYSAGNNASTNPVAPNFQFHHQPFNYYAALDPATQATARAAHLKDYTKLVADAAAGTLPAVTWYKPEGDLNQHPGYTNVAAADSHLADLVAKLKASPQYKNMVIVITYDEFGGQWDHVRVPTGDLLGPGTRIPALIISPYAKAGTVDHTQYDTGSTLRLISRVFGTGALAGVTARDAALKANGGTAMGDMVAALNL